MVFGRIGARGRDDRETGKLQLAGGEERKRDGFVFFLVQKWAWL